MRLFYRSEHGYIQRRKRKEMLNRKDDKNLCSDFFLVLFFVLSPFDTYTRQTSLKQKGKHNKKGDQICVRHLHLGDVYKQHIHNLLVEEEKKVVSI